MLHITNSTILEANKISMQIKLALSIVALNSSQIQRDLLLSVFSWLKDIGVIQKVMFVQQELFAYLFVLYLINVADKRSITYTIESTLNAV